MVKTKEKLMVFLVGAMLYANIEVMWRGYTHWSMAFTGGICLLIIYSLSATRIRYVPCATLCAMLITFAELLVGLVFNVLLKKEIWDYSSERFDLLGQICPKYSFYWFALCLAAIPLCRLFKRKLNYLFSGTMG